MRYAAGSLTAVMIGFSMVGMNLAGARAGAQEFKVLHNLGRSMVQTANSPTEHYRAIY